MSRIQGLLHKARTKPASLRFEDLLTLAEGFGFQHRRTKGSHRIYARDGVHEILNFQDVGGMAKPYQVRQLLRLIDQYELRVESE